MFDQSGVDGKKVFLPRTLSPSGKFMTPDDNNTINSPKAQNDAGFVLDVRDILPEASGASQS